MAVAAAAIYMGLLTRFLVVFWGSDLHQSKKKSNFDLKIQEKLGTDQLKEGENFGNNIKADNLPDQLFMSTFLAIFEVIFEGRFLNS